VVGEEPYVDPGSRALVDPHLPVAIFLSTDRCTL
jgi:hypothetical protein